MDWQLLQYPMALGQGNWTISTTANGVALPTNPISWLSPEVRTTVLGTVVPAAVVIWMLSYDFLSTLHYPTSVLKAFRFLLFPFTNFLHLEDLEEAPGDLQVVPLWKVRLLATVSCLEALVWSAWFTYDEFAGAGLAETVQAAVGFATWVSTTVTIYRRFADEI